MNFKESIAQVLSATNTFKTEEFDFTQSSLVLVTAAGTIVGTPEHNLSESKDLNDVFTLNVLKSAEQYTEEKEKNFIVLKNVELFSNGTTQKFASLIVFTSDIIAITLGRRN